MTSASWLEEIKKWLEKHSLANEFFTKNARAYNQFIECFDCKWMYLYREDVIPYGKCTHPDRPMMKIPCKCKKKKWKGGEYRGIKIPDLKE